MTRKWNIDNDQLKANYDVGNEIIYNTEVIKFQQHSKTVHHLVNVLQKLTEQQ